MIIGIGHDLTDVTRVSGMLAGSLRDRFLQRVLTEGEQKVAMMYSGTRLDQYVAGRFAAKEAIVKAFGCGIGKMLGFGDIGIDKDDCGKPICTLSPAAWERLKLDSSAHTIHITITHERTLASAFAIVEWNG